MALQLACRGSPAHRTLWQMRGVASTPLDAGLAKLLSGDEVVTEAKHFDLAVVGGGSGGLAAAREAARLGAKVLLADYVPPSPAGSTWGLGGTCVNVGCIPKKLMHHTALLGEAVSDARTMGWDVPGAGAPTLDWSTLVLAVSDVRRSSNWMYKSALWDAEVEYVNAWGTFDTHGRLCLGGSGPGGEAPTKDITAENVLVAPGTRPRGLVGASGPLDHLCVTSDDIFTLPALPGRVVVVGAGYIALEMAGILAGLGSTVTCLVRSTPLRGFDSEFGGKVVADLMDRGVTFHPGAVEDIEEVEGGLRVTTGGKVFEADLVLNATGRAPITHSLGLGGRGYDEGLLQADGGFIRVQADGSCQVQGAVPGTFAVGDVVVGNPQLTPAAIKEGSMLARRLFGGATSTLSKHAVPTTVFTPLEYACVGMGEEEAVAVHPLTETYRTNMTPTEWGPPDLWKPKNKCSAKVVVALPDSAEVQAAVAAGLPASSAVPPWQQQVVGVHFFGPNAGEVMQGFAVAMAGGLTLQTLQDTVGIHPTLAEELVYLTVTRSSGESPDKQLCCG